MEGKADSDKMEIQPDSKPIETPHKAKQRHKQEIKALKKTLQPKKKGAKKEMKTKVAALEAVQALELKEITDRLANVTLTATATGKSDNKPKATGDTSDAAVGSSEGADNTDAGTANDSGSAKETVKEVTVTEVTSPPVEMTQVERKRAKAQRKRDNKKKREEARRKEIEEEVKKMAPDKREQEDAALGSKLADLHLGVKEIVADGHCLYRSLGDQLLLRGVGENSEAFGPEGPSVSVLRRLAAEFLREHREDFIPFFTSEKSGGIFTTEEYESYCDSVTQESPVVWGGHPEIVALSKCLGRKIIVHSAEGPAAGLSVLPHLEEEETQLEALEISFHQHYFGLGAHYNSVTSV